MTEPAPEAEAGGLERVDVLLVQKGLARSRAIARDAVRAGRVTADGVVVQKASLRCSATADLAVTGEPERYVGRAAYKLLAALNAFAPHGLEVHDRRALDVGASTGGFTQVLLEHGAREVVALDVGHDQLVAEIAEDPRVVDRSGTSVRDVDVAQIGGPFELVVVDLSFISVRLVLGRLASLTAPDGDLVLLVKPQFEVGRERLGRGGVVRSTHERARVLGEVLDAVVGAGMAARGVVPSAITGEQGNQEYLVWARRTGPGMMEEERSQLLRRVAEGQAP